MFDPFFAAHSRRVAAWYAHRAKAHGPDAASDLCGRAAAALVAATRESLGDPTAVALVDRVLSNAQERFPWLGPLKFSRGRLTAFPKSHLAAHPDAARFIVTEFVATLSTLTGGVLNDRLYEELEKL